MDWHVEIAAQAENDITEIYWYIAYTLLEPGIAWNQIERIRKNINKLSNMPERFPIIDEEPWKSRGVRRLIIDNYVAFYVLDAELNTVKVIRVLYARRNFIEILNTME